MTRTSAAVCDCPRHEHVNKPQASTADNKCCDGPMM